jgi:D-sedoheptulose 7-phosphate isomerase
LVPVTVDSSRYRAGFFRLAREVHMGQEIESMTARIRAGADASAITIRGLTSQAESIAAVCAAVVDVLCGGGRVLTAGNGGSAAEAMHMAEELVGRYRGNRRSLPGIALTADGTALTCIGNDFGFDHIFSRQVEGLGTAGDLLVVFSTSGGAANLHRAVDAARAQGMRTVCILGRDGGVLAGRGDYEIIVPGDATARIQEAHQVILHLILEEVERVFFAS